MLQFLNSCAQVEETIGEIYRTLAAEVTCDEEFKICWREMAEDEDDHARQIRLASRLPAKHAFSGEKVSVEEIGRLLELVRQRLEQVRKRAPGLREALTLSLELEQDFQQVHVTTAVEFKEDSLRELFERLAHGDEEHHARLQAASGSLHSMPTAGAGA